MKAKLMALLLAVGLGVTGVAATVQAAEVGTHAVNECAHSGQIAVFTDVLYSVNWGGAGHYVEYETSYYCSQCKKKIYTEQKATSEPHDYEQIYFDNGSVMSYCTICDDYYFW